MKPCWKESVEAEETVGEESEQEARKLRPPWETLESQDKELGD